MGRLEKYGVCALLFVIVTVLAVSIWGPRPKKVAPASGAGARTAAAAKDPSPTPGPAGARPLGESAPGAPGAISSGTQGVPSPGPLLPSGGGADKPLDRPGIAVPGTAGGPVGPVPGGPVRYVIKKGETLEVVAKRELGSAARWEEILKWNEGIDPKRLRAGQEIVLPPTARVATGSPVPASAAPVSPPPTSTALLTTAGPSTAKAPPLAPGKADRTHMVAKGDTLYAISQRYYGKGTRYRDIFEANREVLSNERALRVGMTLVIP